MCCDDDRVQRSAVPQYIAWLYCHSDVYCVGVKHTCVYGVRLIEQIGQLYHYVVFIVECVRITTMYFYVY